MSVYSNAYHGSCGVRRVQVPNGRGSGSTKQLNVFWNGTVHYRTPIPAP